VAQPAAAPLRLGIGRLLAQPAAALDGARGQLMPFAPVLLALGIGLYFALPVEPAPGVLAALGAAALALGIAGLRGPVALRLPAMAAALLAAGVALAGARALTVAAPVLSGRLYGPIEGRVVALDRSASDALRLTLDRVVLPGRDPARTPDRVRLSLHGPEPETEPIPGTRVALTGHLAPPNGPTEPGGFDFRRLAWFEGLGAVGYTRNPLVELAPPEPGWALAVTRLRMLLSAGLRARLPGEPGGFVAAVLTGDRSGVGLATTEALRASNLAHLLAISGLHMGLLTAVVFGAVRGGLALVPPLALRLPLRKIAAVVALAAAAFYLALSGGNVATERAFIMVSVMLVAILADRRALSIRSVAIAALIVLAWQPEALLTPGFQMSFAATIALVATFAHLRDPPPDPLLPRRRRRPRTAPWLRRMRDLVLCSLVAGLATAPIAAAQFHRLAEYGLIANLLSVPLMGALIMPAAVAAAALWPLGLEALPLWVMQAGARWILAVAAWVAALDGATRPVAAPPGWVLPVLSLGALWLILWPGRARLLGIAPMAVAALAWGQAPRPMVLIAQDGALVGVMGPEGRALSRASGAGFAARAWLAADGDPADQATAAARPGFAPVPGGSAADLPEGRLVHLWGRDGPRAVAEQCTAGATVVLAARLAGPPLGPCRLIDARALARSGALAIGPGARWPSAAVATGARPWSGRRPP
jgi:competence protein ComEC